MRERFRVDARTSANESAAAQNLANAAFVRNTNSSDTAPPTMDTNWDALDTEAHSHGADTVLAAVATCAGRRLCVFERMFGVGMCCRARLGSSGRVGRVWEDLICEEKDHSFGG